MTILRDPPYADKDKAIQDLVFNAKHMHKAIPSTPVWDNIVDGTIDGRIEALERQQNQIKVYLEKLSSVLRTGS